MSIYCCADLGDKQVAFANLTTVEMQTFNLFVRTADYLNRLNNS